MTRFINISLCVALLTFAVPSHAGLIFQFEEVAGDIVMSTSGSIDTRGLVAASLNTWGGLGVEENGNHDILGNTTGGQVDRSFGFNGGTDFSAWASAGGPWDITTGFFGVWTVGGDNKSFTTYIRDAGIQVPGLGIVASDLVNGVWSSNQTWTLTGETFASRQMNAGIYTVTDALSGEFISIRIGPAQQVPEPGALALLGIGLLGLAVRRRRAKTRTFKD